MTKAKIKAEHDPVNKPSHYRQHNSGVECIDLAEVLSFNVGNSYKYTFRRDEKENPLQDLQKAMWYLEREIKRLTILDLVPSAFRKDWTVNPDFSLYHWALSKRVIVEEPNPDVSNFYQCLLVSTTIDKYLDNLKDAQIFLNKLIKTYEPKEEVN